MVTAINILRAGGVVHDMKSSNQQLATCKNRQVVGMVSMHVAFQ